MPGAAFPLRELAQRLDTTRREAASQYSRSGLMWALGSSLSPPAHLFSTRLETGSEVPEAREVRWLGIAARPCGRARRYELSPATRTLLPIGAAQPDAVFDVLDNLARRRLDLAVNRLPCYEPSLLFDRVLHESALIR